jgi:hypothetical protein
VTTLWIPKSKKLSEKIKELQTTADSGLSDRHVQFLLKYSHSIQDKLAEVFSVKKKSRKKASVFLV